MIPVGKLIDHENYHLRMVAVHRAWAHQYRKRGNDWYETVQFQAARDRLEEARIVQGVNQ